MSDHVITKIDLLKHKSGQGGAAGAITDGIIREQKIAVDAISGATLSSRVIQKAVEPLCPACHWRLRKRRPTGMRAAMRWGVPEPIGRYRNALRLEVDHSDRCKRWVWNDQQEFAAASAIFCQTAKEMISNPAWKRESSAASRSRGLCVRTIYNHFENLDELLWLTRDLFMADIGD